MMSSFDHIEIQERPKEALEFQRIGVTFHKSLRAEPWGARTFIVADPDGNLICFAGGPS